MDKNSIFLRFIHTVLCAKPFRIAIEALDFRIKAYEQQIIDENATEDEISDMNNDSQLLQVIKKDLESKKDW